MKSKDRLIEIRTRWKATQAVELWRSLPESDCKAVLAEIEEAAREATSAKQKKGLTAALDVLDFVSSDGALGLWNQAISDIAWLLAQLDE